MVGGGVLGTMHALHRGGPRPRGRPARGGPRGPQGLGAQLRPGLGQRARRGRGARPRARRPRALGGRSRRRFPASASAPTARSRWSQHPRRSRCWKQCARPGDAARAGSPARCRRTCRAVNPAVRGEVLGADALHPRRDRRTPAGVAGAARVDDRSGRLRLRGWPDRGRRRARPRPRPHRRGVAGGRRRSSVPAPRTPGSRPPGSPTRRCAGAGSR